MRAVVSLSERYLDERIGAFLCDRVVQSVSKDIPRYIVRGERVIIRCLLKRLRFFFSLNSLK